MDFSNIIFEEMDKVAKITFNRPGARNALNLELLAEMIKVAAGEPLSIRQEDVAIRGHAIEVRINAEDPAANFMPFPGIVGDLRVPGGPGVRFDHMLYQGYQIPPFYDSLLGKLIVSADTRDKAIIRLKRAIGELRTDGLKTTAPLFTALAEAPDVLSGTVHTKWLEPWLEANSDKLSGQ